MLWTILGSPAARYVGILAIAALALWGVDRAGYRRGVADCERVHTAVLASHLQRAATQAAEIALQDAEISESYEIWRTRTVTKVEEVTREIPADCAACRISPNGLSLLNNARSGGLPMASDPGQPHDAVPTPPAAQGGDDAGTRGRRIDGRTSIQRLSSEAWPVDPGGAGAGI